MRKKSLKEIGSVVTDPGVAWGICDILLFSHTSLFGTLAFGAAALIAGGCKYYSNKKVHPRLSKIINDSRTPLRTAGIASIILAGAALTAGASLPATLGVIYALTDFKTAESISAAQRQDTPPPALEAEAPRWKTTLKTLFKRPDLYAATGLMLTGLLSGGASLWALPLVVTGLGISLRNAMKKLPEHSKHPKIIYSMASAVFAGVGLFSGAFMPAIANTIACGIFCIVESRITPGGYKKIFSDLKTAARKLISPNKDRLQEFPSFIPPRPQKAFGGIVCAVSPCPAFAANSMPAIRMRKAMHSAQIQKKEAAILRA